MIWIIIAVLAFGVLCWALAAAMRDEVAEDDAENYIPSCPHLPRKRITGGYSGNSHDRRKQRRADERRKEEL